MKTKLILLSVALSAFAIQTSAVTTHVCAPANPGINTESISQGHLTLYWTHSEIATSCEPATGYQVKVYIRGSGNNSNLELYTDEGSDPVSVQVDLPAGASLSWRVRSVCGNQNGLWHEFKNGYLASLWVTGPAFNTTNERMEPWQDDFDVDALSVFPNPVVENVLKVRINSGQELPATLEIVNAIGKVVRQEKFQLYGGSNLGMFDVATLQKGIYFVRVSEGNKTHTVKFMIF